MSKLLVSSRTPLRASLCAALLTLAGMAGAQVPSPTPATPPGPMAQHQCAHGPATPEQRQQRQQRHAEALKQKLALSADQETAWASFQQAMQPPARPAPAQDWKQLNTPQRLDQLRGLQSQRMAELDRRAEATKAFYAVLRPEQQRVFDEQGLQRWGHFGPGGHGGSRGHGGHGWHGRQPG